MNVLSILTTILGLAAVAGGALAWFAKGRGDTLIDLLTKENKVLQDGYNRLEKDVAARDARIGEMQVQITSLKDLAQGNPQLVELTKEIKGLVQFLKDRP